MINLDLFHQLAEEIREHVRSQDWHEFLQYNGIESGSTLFQVRDGALIIAGTYVAIRCADGEIVKSDMPAYGQLAPDVAVVHFFTNVLVYDTQALPQHMLSLLRP